MVTNNTNKTTNVGSKSNTGKISNLNDASFVNNVGESGRENNVNFALWRNKNPRKAKKHANILPTTLTH